jgi:hypothetical protein
MLKRGRLSLPVIVLCLLFIFLIVAALLFFSRRSNLSSNDYNNENSFVPKDDSEPQNISNCQETKIIVKSNYTVLDSGPKLMNIPNKSTELLLRPILIDNLGTKELSSEKVEYLVSHPVDWQDPLRIISIDAEGVARYISEGFVFVKAKYKECPHAEDNFIIATGDVYGSPEQDDVIAVFPRDYVPSGSSFSFGAMTENYSNMMKMYNSAYFMMSDFYGGFRPYNGDKQILAFLVKEGHCGANNNPLQTAPECYMNVESGTPQYNVVIHEMGHNFASTKGMEQLTRAKNGKLGDAGFGECVASLPVQYFASRIVANPGEFGLNNESYEWKYYNDFLTSDISDNKRTLDNFEKFLSEGKIDGFFDLSSLGGEEMGRNRLDKVSVFCSFFVNAAACPNEFENQYGWEFYRRFLSFFPDRELEDFDENKVDTYFAAAYSAAVGHDMRQKLRFWGFDIDDEYFSRIYPALLERVG